jgi:adenosine deaminase
MMQTVIAQNRTFETAESDLQIQIQQGQPAPISSNGSSLSPELLSLIGLGIFLLLLLSMLKAIFHYKEVPMTVRPTDRVPCKHCKFYSSNPILKCAIHPSKVLTPDAIHCPDYCFKYHESEQNSLSKR